jgi:hypothetical protein
MKRVPCLWIPALLLAAASLAFPQMQPPAPAGIRILAISKPASGATRDKILPIMPEEVKATVRLYLDGKIQEWYSRADGTGVIFLMNCKDAAEAHTLLEDLPLGKAKLLEFDLIPVSPLAPLRFLLGDAPAKQPSNP